MNQLACIAALGVFVFLVVYAMPSNEAFRQARLTHAVDKWGLYMTDTAKDGTKLGMRSLQNSIAYHKDIWVQRIG